MLNMVYGVYQHLNLINENELRWALNVLTELQ